MKKFYMILAALLIGSVCFAQFTRVNAIKLANPVSAERSDWVGNTAVGTIVPTANGDEIAIAPKQFNPTLTGTITKIKFYHTTYGTTYTNASYTLKIYNNINLAGDYASMGFYDETSCGEAVYTQDFTATEEGWQEITLNTSYTIPDGNFWVSVVANGVGVFAYGGEASAVEGQYYVKSAVGTYGTFWMTPEFGQEGSEETTLFSGALAVYVEDGQAYVETSDFEVRFFGGISNNQLTPAQASYTLTADQTLSLLPFFANNGADDAETGTVTFDLTINGISMMNGGAPTDLGTADDTIKIEVGGWYNLLEAPYAYTISAQDMIDAGLSGTFDVCLTVSYTGNDPNTTNNRHCIPVTLNVTSVEENIAEAVSVYPNPANDMFTVANAEGATIVVVNSLGQVVASIENAASNQTIDASNFANGTYFVKVNENVVKINVVK